MKKQPGHRRHSPPYAYAAAAASRAGSDVVAGLQDIAVALITIAPDMRIIGFNDACHAAMLRLCGWQASVQEDISTVPIQIDTPVHGRGTLEEVCRHAFSREPFYITGLCGKAAQARSVLLKFTPVLDAFSRPLMLHMAIQDFPGDSLIDAAYAAGDVAIAAEKPGLGTREISADELRLSVDAAPVGIAHVAPDGRILHVNRFLARMLGYSPGELTSMHYQDITYPVDLETDSALVQEALQGKRHSYVMEKRYLRRDGSPVWAYLAVTLIRDEAGAPKHFISVVSSIQSQKKALSEVEEGRARLKAVFDSLSEAVFVFNAKGEVVDANRAGLRMFGYHDVAAADSGVMRLDEHFEAWTLNSERLPQPDWPVYRVLRGERVNNVELKIRQIASGRKWIASFSGSPASDSGSMARLAVLTIRDITKRHYAEISLRISEQRFRTAFDHIPDMIVLYDRNLRVRYVNHAMEEAARRPASSLVGRSSEELGETSLMQPCLALPRTALQSLSVQRGDFEFSSPQGTRYVAATCVPLVSAKGQAEEIMCLYHDYTERKHAEERARQAALHDPLTHLPNRALLFEYARHVLGGARRLGERVAVLFVDLDRFKPINDLHGHEAGDEVLRQVAQRFRTRLREDAMVFRLGGDEFLVLLPRAGDTDAVADVALQLLKALERPYYVGHLKLALSASIGISLFPDDGNEIDMLIQHADAAMYYAKQRGRNGFQVYFPQMTDHANRQAVIEQELKRAIEQKEFRLCYQPVLDMHNGEMVCAEALIRWPGNSAGADRFVPIAEITGLIGQVGDWVLEEACRQHQRWQAEGLAAIPIAINVSPVQFRRHDLAEHVLLTLQRYGLDSAAIQLELTETAVMDDIDRAVDVLGRLRASGIRISLDDFGTGYSSLNYLSRLPLDKLKIDQTFVQRIESDNAGRAITDAIIVLGRTLGLTVVAEGIETESALIYLRDRGCNQGQGYQLCRPLAGRMLADWVRARKRGQPE